MSRCDHCILLRVETHDLRFRGRAVGASTDSCSPTTAPAWRVTGPPARSAVRTSHRIRGLHGWERLWTPRRRRGRRPRKRVAHVATSVLASGVLLGVIFLVVYGVALRDSACGGAPLPVGKRAYTSARARVSRNPRPKRSFRGRFPTFPRNDRTLDRSDGAQSLIAGGGVAALEAAFALRSLAADRVSVATRSEPHFWYRPLAVAEPFQLERCSTSSCRRWQPRRARPSRQGSSSRSTGLATSRTRRRKAPFRTTCFYRLRRRTETRCRGCDHVPRACGCGGDRAATRRDRAR